MTLVRLRRTAFGIRVTTVVLLRSARSVGFRRTAFGIRVTTVVLLRSQWWPTSTI